MHLRAIFTTIAVSGAALSGCERPTSWEGVSILPWESELGCVESDLDLAERFAGTGPRTVLSRTVDVRHPVGRPDPKVLIAYPLEDGHEFWTTEPVLRTYVVRGDTLDDAMEGVNQRVGRRAMRDIGMAEFEIRILQARDGQQADASDITRPERLTLTQTVLLPEWQGYDGATAEEQRAWDEFNCHVLHHERAHIIINTHVMADYAGDLPRGAAGPNRRDMRAFVNKLYSIMHARNDDYHYYVYDADHPGRGAVPLELSGYTPPRRSTPADG